MAAELESMFYTGATPWHGEGVHVESCLTSAEALQKSGLDWEVEKRAVSITEPSILVVPDFWAIVRKTDGKPLGVVGSRFLPLQNKDAFTMFDQLVGQGLAIYETAGSLRGGRVIWIMSKLPGDLGVGDDRIQKYLLLSNAHDGTRQVRIVVSPVRTVCMNTLQAAENQAEFFFQLRHTSGMMDRAQDVQEALAKVYEAFDGIQTMMEAYRQVQVSKDELQTYIRSLFPTKIVEVKKDEDQEDRGLADVVAEMTAETSTRAKTYISKVEELVETGKGTDLPGVKGTLWGAYNAACEFADHWLPVKQNKYGNSTETRKLDSIWFGSARDFKVKAFKAAEKIREKLAK